MPAFKVGVLDDAIKKGDKAALEYYNVPAKHWTSQSWNEINMDKVDIGLHSDPTATGSQAADRRLATMLRSGAGVDDTKDLRIHIGNELVALDVGGWDNPPETYQGILNALEDAGDWDAAEQFAEEFSYLPSGSTIDGDVNAVSNMAAMRDFLLGKDYDTITYKNTSEGADAASDAYLKDPEWQAYESETKAKIKDLELRASELYRAGKTDSGLAFENWNDSGLRQQYEDLISQASELDDDLEYARSDAMQRAADENISHISLDPGNVRSADAAFSKENIGKAGMMLGLGGAAMLGGSNDAEASVADLIRIGYPEPTARRIASGELPMDTASRMARAMDQGYDIDNPVFHGTGSDFYEFDPLQMGKTDDGWFGKGFYFTPDPNIANQYAYGQSPNVGQYYLNANNPYDWRTNDGYGMSQATTEERYRKTRDILDAGYDSVDVTSDKIRLAPDQELTDEQWMSLVRASPAMSRIGRDAVTKSLRRGFDFGPFSDAYGEDVARSLPMERPVTERVVFDNNNIRSVNAAFDPEYKGPNILGQYALPVAGGLSALGAATGSQDAEAGVLPKRFLDPNYTPTNTQTAYKMFRTDGNELYPLFVDRNTPVNVGDWQRAIAGDMDPKTGKVKSSLGGLAYRPGWHAGDNAAATHIGGKSDPLLKAPDIRKTDQVWAEVLMGDDFNWQDIANQRATRNKSGEIVPRTAQIDDQVPFGGSYRYKTNPNMTGEWLIGGDMKVNRVLSDEEVADINASKGYADLPRQEKSRFLDPLLEKYGKAFSALVPSATIGALAGMSPMDAGAATLDVANRIGEDFINMPLQGSQMLSNAIYDTRDAAPQVQFAPRTEAGGALSEALSSDLGDVLNYSGIVNGMPSTADIISGGMDLYDEHLAPLLSERQEMGLGGTALAMASMLGLKGDLPKRTTTVNTADTRLGSQTAAAGRKMMKNQPAQVREALAEAGDYETVVSGTYDLKDLPVLTADDLSGAALMPTLGDRTAFGTLEKVQGMSLDKPLQLQSGPQYGMASLDNADNPAAWESTADIAKSYQNKVKQVANAAGTDNVLGIYSPMKLEAANFSTMPAEVALRQFQQLVDAGAKYDPAMVRAIDDAVRFSGSDSNPWKDFPGIMSDEAEEWLTRLMKGLPTARKAMLNTMNAAPFRDAGFPLIDQIYRDVSVPELADRSIGESGDVIMRLDPRGATDNYSNHRSYGTRIPGEVIGRLDGTLSHSELYIDPYRQLEGAMTKSKQNKKTGEWSVPRLLNSLEKTNTVAWNKPKTKDARTTGYQMGTDELIDYLLQQSLIRP